MNYRCRELEPAASVTFGICLASQQTVVDWKQTSNLLALTLRSVLRQHDDRFRVLICGHEMPEIPEMHDPRVEFLSLDFPPPTPDQPRPARRADKSRKRLNLGRKLRELGGGYFMQLDADDLVHRDLVTTILSRKYKHGAMLDVGFVWDHNNGLVAPVPGVWSFGLSHVSGSTSVVRYEPDDLPAAEDTIEDALLLFNMTRTHTVVRSALEESGRRLGQIDTPMLLYSVNHGGNLSFLIQKSGDRGAHIIREIRRRAVTDPSALRQIDAFFGTNFAPPVDDAGTTPVRSVDLKHLFPAKTRPVLGWHRIADITPPIQTLIDVGAGPGTIELYKAFPHTKMYAVDPLEENRRSLEDLQRDYDLEIMIMAAGSLREDRVFSILKRGLLSASSFLERKGRLAETGAETEARVVNIRRLDDVLRDMNDPAGLKIDAEGFEREVILGATGIMQHIQWIITETSFVERFEKDPMFEGIYSAIESYGFRFRDIVDSVRQPDGRLRHMDILFVKENA